MVKLPITQGKGTKFYEFYTRQEIDNILYNQSRLSGRATLINVGGGGDSPSSGSVLWGNILEKPFTNVNESTGYFSVTTDTLTLPQAIGTTSEVTFKSVKLSDLTEGGIPFASSSKKLVDAPTEFFWDNANKRLGIGTNSPDERIHILGTAPYIRYRDSEGTTNWRTGVSDDDFYIFVDGTSRYFVLKADGKALIGDGDSPQTLFELRTATQNERRITFSDASDTYNPIQLGMSSGDMVVHGGASLDRIFELESDGDIKTYKDVSDPNFATGWIADGGRGYAIYQDPDVDTQWNAEYNNLLIRGRLKVFELIVKQISVLGGTEILSVAVAEADSVTGSTGSEVVEITDPRDFGGTSLAVNDLVIVQRVDLNDVTVVKQEFRTVSTIDGTEVTFTSTSGAPAPSDPIEAGDILVAYGNTSDTDRQNIIYRNVDSDTSKVINRLQVGIDSYAKFNSPFSTTRFAYGDINGFADYASQTWGVFLGDNAGVKMTQDVTNGLRMMDADDNVLAQLSTTIFKIGDTNYINFNSDTGKLDIRTDEYFLDSVTDADGGIRMSSTDRFFKMFRSESGAADEVLAIGPDEIAPDVTLKNTDTLATVSFHTDDEDVPGNLGTKETEIYDSSDGLIENDPLELDYTITHPGVVFDQYSITITIQGRVTSGSWDDLVSTNFDVDSTATVEGTLLTNSLSYDDIRVSIFVRNYFDSDGPASGTVLDFDGVINQYNATIVVNSNGMFTRVAPTVVLPMFGGSGSGGVSGSLTATWSDVTSKPFATLDSRYPVVSDELLPPLIGTSVVTADTYSITTSDEGKLLIADDSGTASFIIPNNTSQAFSIGSSLAFSQNNGGTITIVGAVGVTVNSLDGSSNELSGDYSTAAVVKVGTNSWILTNSGQTASSGGGGISDVDMWWLTTTQLTATPAPQTNYLTTNLSRINNQGFAKLGDGMSVSSGVFTFPSTGLWHIRANAIFRTTASAERLVGLNISTTINNGSSWYENPANATAQTSMFDGGAGVQVLGNASTDFIFNVTNTGTHKVRFYWLCFDDDTEIRGDTEEARTFFTFTRLSDNP